MSINQGLRPSGGDRCAVDGRDQQSEVPTARVDGSA
jgi:hypothetical protein